MMTWEEKLSSVPHKPGVYIFKDSSNQVIYIGKAKDLRKRLSSYKVGKDGRILLPFLLSEIADFEFIVTSNEVEAFLLEDTLIKKYKPLYNIRLRDDKTYVSLEVTVGDDFPGVYIIRRKPRKKDSLVFGPYSSASSVRETLRYILRVFPIRTCTDTKMKMHRDRPCIYYQIKRCSAPCTGYVSKEEYGEYVKGLIRFLKGDGQYIVEDLRRKMKEYASNMEFEKAAEYRDRIKALEKVLTAQSVVVNKNLNADYISWAYGEGHLVISRIIVRGGRLIDRQNYSYHPVFDPEEQVASYIYQLYRMVTNPPSSLYIENFEGLEILKELLGKLDLPVDVKVGGKGVNKKLLDLARENAETQLDVEISSGGIIETLQFIQKRFKLKNLPRRIECVDISELGGKEAVGSMVTFVDCAPDKNEYRRYKIRSIEGIDDFGMIREVLSRRLDEERELPDLILIDGGRGQLSVARRVLKEKGLEEEIDLLAIAKDRGKGKGERIFIPGRVNPVKLRPVSAEFKLLTFIRDEAHRFAIKYNRLLRKKNIRSVLLEIPGIGKKRAELLWKNFSSLEEMAKNPSRISEILKIPLQRAEEISDKISSLIGTEIR